jgi:RNA polymerase subunit RPABC4/transcription elongation factor Spt4
MIPRNWRLQQQRYRLAGKVCENCNKMTFPPRNVCPACESMAQTSLFAGGFSIPVEIVKRETQSGNAAKVLVYGYQSRLVATSAS